MATRPDSRGCDHHYDWQGLHWQQPSGHYQLWPPLQEEQGTHAEKVRNWPLLKKMLCFYNQLKNIFLLFTVLKLLRWKILAHNNGFRTQYENCGFLYGNYLFSRFQLVIMDESHCIKNDKSARTKAAEPIMKVNYLSVITFFFTLLCNIENYHK